MLVDFLSFINHRIMKTIKNKQYGWFAHAYDSLMSRNKYDRWAQLIKDVVEKYDIKKGPALDVACGTGQISSSLAALGFQVTGIDLSAKMIGVAKRKKLPIKFVVADMRNLSLPKQEFVLATSFYDSLNYLLSDDDMLKTFKSVYRHLSPGGMFLFDMNTRQHVLAAQKYKPRVSEGKDFYSIFRFGGEDRVWTIDIDVFIKQKSVYKLFREHHRERGYDKADISPLLEKAGFSLILTKIDYAIYEDNKKRPSRLYFLAKKS